MKIAFVTSNEGKLKEVKLLLEPLGFEVLATNVELTEIQGSQEEVVKHKCLEARKHVAEALVVEDTGFYIDAYKDFPGVYARHVVAAVGIEGILKMVSGTNREAHFLSLVAYLPENSAAPVLFKGECKGRIATYAPTSHHFGLPYDSIFIPDGCEKTCGEMSAGEKNRYSHRAKAFQALARYFGENK